MSDTVNGGDNCHPRCCWGRGGPVIEEKTGKVLIHARGKGLARAVQPPRMSEVPVFFVRFPLSVSFAICLAATVRIAAAAPCPPPPAIAPAAITPDGRAQILTASDTTACWWTVDDNGDAEVVRHFDVATSAPTAIRWDDRRGAICIDVVDADGTRRERLFPQGAP